MPAAMPTRPPTLPPSDPRHAFALGAIARETVRAAAAALAGPGLRVAPLKGVLLHALGVVDPSQRPVSDADLLVEPASFDAATERLAALGYTRVRDESGSHQRRARFLSGHPHLLGIDLHARLFDPSRYRLDTAGLFARARRDDTLFGAPVWLLAPEDLYAHLVGHLAHDWVRRSDAHHPRDLAAVANRLHLQVGRVADHLVRCGLARAARVALPHCGDPFARDVLAALPTDRIGSLARVASLLPRRGARPDAPLRRATQLLMSASVPGSLAGALRRRLSGRADLD